MKVHDVIVIGAGPAGLASAEALACRGHDTLVLEEHAAVGYPVHCTGVIGHDAFDELNLPRETILGFCRSATFLAPDGPEVLVETDHIVAAVVDRGRFDDLLAARARAAGATLLTGSRVTRVEVRPDGVEVRMRGEEHPRRGRACILACGARYRFNHELGLGVPTRFVQSAQVEVPFVEIPHIEVHLGREVAPSGFAWAVPFKRDGRPFARLGLMCERDSRRRFHLFVESLGRRLGLGALRVPGPRLRFLPLGPVQKTYAPRVLAVGDAAGLVKPTTGGGIYYGLLSGQLAAATLSVALDRDELGEGSLRRYDTLWRERLGPDIRAGLAFRAVAARLSDRGIRALVELARVDGIIPLLKQNADFNWHRTAALAMLRHPSFRRIVLGSILG